MPGTPGDAERSPADQPAIDLHRVTASDARRLLATARTDWSRPIPHCPGWDAAHLVGHLGGIFAWMTRIVSIGQPVAREDRETPPGSPDALATWYLEHLDGVLDTLTRTAPSTPTWTFSSRGAGDVGWWRRRLAVETAIHRWDVEHAATASPRPLDAEVAAAGIEEFMVEFLPGLLAHAEPGDLVGTLCLRGTNDHPEWSVDLDARGDARAVPGSTTFDTGLRGTTSDLLLWLTNREPHTPLEVVGQSELLHRWDQLKR